jgi:NADPH:quinone reductase-like Zn-dependent oxidoreductase
MLFRNLSIKASKQRIMATMKAAVIYTAGGPEVLKLERRPIPTPTIGQVLIKVKAFGLNRSELFTRQGHSPNVKFPRILGIEATGIVESCPGNEFSKGVVVATAMGDMGRAFDGGYAEYTCVPARQVQAIQTELPWDVLGALPEMLETAWGSLFKALQLKKGDRLLVRGGTTSVGLAAAAIAKNHGAYVASTTRRADRSQMLKESGADEVFVDDGNVAKQLEEEKIEKFNKVLELVGTTTLEDSLLCAKQGGLVCMTGMVGNKWYLEKFAPMGSIPTAVGLTTYAGDSEDFMATPLEELAKQVKDGRLKIQIGKTFNLDDIVEAHRCMEENKAGGKIVVLT